MTRIRHEAAICLCFLALAFAIATVRGIEEVCVKEGTQYHGTRNFTSTGLSCIPWKDIQPTLSGALFPESNVDDAKNYCRNPEKKIDDYTPYCYIDARTTASCNIDKCYDKKGFELTSQTCAITIDQTGFTNGDYKSVFSKNHPLMTKDIGFPGCTVKFDACVNCRYYVTVEAKLPVCKGVSAGSHPLKCPGNCQSIAVFDGSYNTTQGKVFVRAPGTPEDVVGEYWTTSNSLQLKYCQMNSNAAAQAVAFMITVYTTTKEEHLSSSSGVIKSPNFPYGYFSRSEIYMYSVQAPVIDSNMTLLFYDWDLNASAGSKVTIKWGRGNLADSVQYIASSVRLLRPALFIPSTEFTITFETGSVTNWQQDQEVGFLARFNTYDGPFWVEEPDTRCGDYLSVSASRGGNLTYSETRADTKTTYYIDCIWVVEIPKLYTKLQYQLLEYKNDPEAKLSLTIRNGLTSEAPTDIGLDASKRVASKPGIFLHLSGSYMKFVSLNVAFVTYAEPSPVSTCSHIPGAFFCPEYNFCLSNQLFQEWGVSKCQVDKVDPTVSPVVCNAYGKHACKDKSLCYTTIEQCNGEKDCKDGSDEEDCQPLGRPVREDSSVAAIVAPIVIVFIVVPILIVAVYLCKKKLDERKDEELMTNRQGLIESNGGQTVQGFDNLGMEMDEVPISMIAREEKALSRANSQQLLGPDRDSVVVHGASRPGPPRETQSYRVQSPFDKTVPPARGAHSYRFPNDYDATSDLPEAESLTNPRRSDPPYERPPPVPTGAPPDDRQHQYRKRNEKPMTLADYRPGGNPKKRQPSYTEDRTPEGRSFSGDQPQRYPPPHRVNDGPRSPGDGASGNHLPVRERGEKSQPRRRGDQLPGRETQSYRHPPTDNDYDPKPAQRPSRSYRFEPDNPEVVLKPDYRRGQDVRPKSRPKEIGGAHKKTLGQYKPNGRDPRDPKPPRDLQLKDDPGQYKPRRYDQLPDRQTQSYRVPLQSYDDAADPADELRSKSYRFADSQSELSRTPNAGAAPKSPTHVNIEISGTTSI
ncbi:uncharacterized protein LOC135495441 [Lineus longissimus]|uniref:uncharacterized protein LOC135495441 n=1 Tax=Lineus longissimus TaxID=88925 RepID=UPI002B4EBE0A